MTVSNARAGRHGRDRRRGRVLEASATDYAVKAAARALGAEPGDQAEEDRAGAALGGLIAIAQADGDLHPDITVGDFYLLISSAPTDQPADVRARWLTLVLPGLRTRSRI